MKGFLGKQIPQQARFGPIDRRCGGCGRTYMDVYRTKVCPFCMKVSRMEKEVKDDCSR